MFFDCAANNGVLETPVAIIDTPEVKPFTRTTEGLAPLPSLQHCAYTPDGSYLFTVDASSQNRVWSYPVNEQGVVNADADQPICSLKARPIQQPRGLAQWLMASCYGPAIRRIAIHPTGRYIYLLFESHALIQVYEIGPGGKIYSDCLQEIYCLEPHAGLATVQTATELYATTDGLWVSTRGRGVAENIGTTIRCYEYHQKGARSRSVATASLDARGPVQHFCHFTSGPATSLIAGVPWLPLPLPRPPTLAVCRPLALLILWCWIYCCLASATSSLST